MTTSRHRGHRGRRPDGTEKAALLVLALLIASLPSTAVRAQEDAPRSSVAIAMLHFAPATPAAVQKEVDEHLRAEFLRRGYRIHAPADAKTEPTLPRGCTTGPCLAAFGAKLGVDQLFFGGVEALGNSYDLVFTLVDAPTGTCVAQVARRCDVCTFAEVGSLVQHAIDDLTRHAKQVIAAQGRLAVILPRGTKANVWLDGVLLGAAPQRRLLTTGWHLLELRLQKQIISSRRLWITAGRETLIHQVIATIAPLVRTLQPTQQGSVRWPAWLALGGAAALVVAGSVALAFNESCPRDTCTDRRDTSVLGLGLLGAGAAVTFGAGLLVHHYLTHPSGKKHIAGFAISATPRTAAVLYHRRF